MEGWRESEGREEEKHQEGEKETKQFIKKKQDNALQSSEQLQLRLSGRIWCCRERSSGNNGSISVGLNIISLFPLSHTDWLCCIAQSSSISLISLTGGLRVYMTCGTGNVMVWFAGYVSAIGPQLCILMTSLKTSAALHPEERMPLVRIIKT